MSRKNDPSKPAPIKIGSVTAYAMRPPIASNPHWAWRAQRKNGDRATVWSGRAPREDVEALVIAAMAADGAEIDSEDYTDDGGRTIGWVLDCWLAHVKATQRPKSYEIARDRVDALMRHVGNMPASAAITTSGMERFVAARRKDRVRGRVPADSTIQLELSKLKAAYRWASRPNVGNPDADGNPQPLVPPVTEIRLPEGFRGLPESSNVYNDRVPTPDEVWLVLDNIQSKLNDHKQGCECGECAARTQDWRDVLLMLICTGLRPADLDSLTWDQVDMQRGTVRRLKGKTKNKKTQTIPLPADARGEWEPALRRLYMNSSASSEPRRVFGHMPSLRQGTGKVLDRTVRRLVAEGHRVQRFTPKGIRKMVINQMLDQGIPVAKVAKFAGNSPQVIWRNYERSQALDADDLSAAGIGARPARPQASNVVPLRG